MAYKQSSSGIPIFRRVWLVSDAPERKDRALENQIADPRLWDPSDEDFWSVCLPTNPEEQAQTKYRVATPGEDARCRLCLQARSQLIPCCWIHWRCSYTVMSGRACASHFDVVSPMDKIVVTRKDDETIPETHRGLQVVPNTFYPKASKNTLRPSDLMIGLETYWAYKHAWRGAGYLYRKGDHLPATKVVFHLLQMHCH